MKNRADELVFEITNNLNPLSLPYLLYKSRPTSRSRFIYYIDSLGTE